MTLCIGAEVLDIVYKSPAASIKVLLKTALVEANRYVAVDGVLAP